MRVVLTVCLIGLMAALLRLPAFFQPHWYLDEGIFAAVAEVWRHGGSLYGDAWDNKPPGIYAVYALAWSSGADMQAVRLLDLLAMLGTVTLVFVIGVRVAGRAAGIVAAAALALLLGLPTIEAHIANTESFLIVFSSLGVYLTLRSLDAGGVRPVLMVLAGLSLGMACLFKQVAVFDAAAVAVFLLLVSRTDLRPLLALGAGLVTLPLIVGAGFLAFGAFGDLWQAVVTSLVGYRGASGDTGAGRFLVALIPLTIALPFALALRPWQTRAPEALIVLWLAFTALAVAASGRAYPHYLIQMAPPFSVTLGMLASSVSPRLPRASVAAGLVVASLALYHVILGPLGRMAWNVEPQYTRDYYANFIGYVSGHTDRPAYDRFFDSRAYAHLGLFDELDTVAFASRDVFIWGDVPWLYVRQDFENPTPYTMLTNALEVEGSYQAVATLLEQRATTYVIVMDETRETWAQVQPLVGASYRQVAGITGATVYQRLPELIRAP